MTIYDLYKTQPPELENPEWYEIFQSAVTQYCEGRDYSLVDTPQSAINSLNDLIEEINEYIDDIKRSVS